MKGWLLLILAVAAAAVFHASASIRKANYQANAAVVIAAAAAYKADQAQRACTPLYLQKPKEFEL